MSRLSAWVLAYHMMSEPESNFVTVAKVGAIAEGAAEVFTVGERLVAVFNLGDGQYYAINDICPHMGASLSAGDVTDGVVTCPWHAWRFRVTDGTWYDNPRLKTDVFEVRVVDDEIQVRAG
jgi:nitrite reductase (NADH) small subunit/3-phenylpropionate/trans-cinnamate dioxygenase ferredoxin subunit